MLKITIHESPKEVAINLEGRVAGPWAEELAKVWRQKAAQRNARPVSLDLREVTYIDDEGKQILRQIENETGAELIASTPWTRQLVAQIRDTNTNA